MPTADPSDQQAARSIEKSLRDAVSRQEQPPIELTWFEALPKRVRRSAKLIEAAQTDSRVLLEHVRLQWSKTRQIELERKERLNRARAQPRNIEVLRAPEPTAWHGLGHRKKRSRAFESAGRAYNARQRLSGSDPIDKTHSSDTFLLHPSSCYVPKRSPTPPGLRDAIRNVPGLIHTAIGPANPADYGLPTQLARSLPSSKLQSPPLVFPPLPSPYIVAFGRHSRAPEAGYSAAQAAVDIYSLEHRFPDALAYLERLLFPDGSGRYSTMVESLGMEPLLDFVAGWFEISRRARELAK
ncbi:hypothetical protein RhiLY_07914 [Ceratobasidium sp. AG-Ba]|nr:hypothetical protein RhiLY_07914 [Ceratobasidium sp. AG-Ba]